jgi:asparaginyl-tRNA synthetase
MSTDDHTLQILKKFGLNDKGATDVLKNSELTNVLVTLDQKFGASKLLYTAATKAETDAQREVVGEYIRDQKIHTVQQLDAALGYLKEHPTAGAGDKALEQEAGIGVVVSDKEIEATVRAGLDGDRDTLMEERYQYNFGALLGQLRRTIKWADAVKVKEELDRQSAALLGPKTEEDLQGGKKKKPKPKPAAAAPVDKPKKLSAEETVAAHEAELAAKMTEAAVKTFKTNLYRPRFHRVRDLLEAAERGEFPDAAQPVTVAGWIRTTRDQRAMVFVELNDGSGPGSLQIVLEPETCPNLDEFKKHGAGYGACIEVVGTVVKSPGRGQLIEMKGSGVRLLGAVAEGFPLAKAALPMDVLRSYPHLRVRTNVMGCVMRIRNVCAFAIHKFFQDRGFQYVHTPILTSNDCEGAGECFAVTTLAGQPAMGKTPPDWAADFFGCKAMLTVSGQLNVETYAAGLGNVYTFGPTFRAENSNTTRHLAEFWMVEPEVWFIDRLGLMDLAEDFLKYCVASVLKDCQADLLYLDQYHLRMEEEARRDEGARRFVGSLIERLTRMVAEPFGRITYTEAIEILREHQAKETVKFVESNIEWGMDLASEHERYLAERVFQKPVIVTNYPSAIKSFYMKQSEDGRTVEGMDILVPTIGEIIGGSTREDDYDRLVGLMRAKGMSEKDVESLAWYTDLRRYGSAPHGGFGLGFERLLLLCTGMLHIRDVVPFPRFPGSLQC